MDQFDRLRYQSKERRRELLEEMIDVELLAAEARRLGIDKEPETEDAVRGILRDALLAQAREGRARARGDHRASEVRAYYDAHLDKFSEPERRRVAAIVIRDRKEAEKVLKDAPEGQGPARVGRALLQALAHRAEDPRADQPRRARRRPRDRRADGRREGR